MVEKKITIPDTSAVEREQGLVVERARALRVKNDVEFERVGNFCADIKKAKANIQSIFKDPKALAHKLHKSLTTRERELMAPFDEADRIARGKAIEYRQEQDRLRMEKERDAREKAEAKARAEAEARQKAEEDRRLMEAEKLHAAGHVAEAERVLDREPIKVEPEPVALPAEPPPAAPENMSFRENWDFEIVEPMMLPREYLIPNTKALRQLAKALKGQARVAGVRFFASTTSTVR